PTNPARRRAMRLTADKRPMTHLLVGLLTVGAATMTGGLAWPRAARAAKPAPSAKAAPAAKESPSAKEMSSPEEGDDRPAPAARDAGGNVRELTLDQALAQARKAS